MAAKELSRLRSICFGLVVSITICPFYYHAAAEESDAYVKSNCRIRSTAGDLRGFTDEPVESFEHCRFIHLSTVLIRSAAIGFDGGRIIFAATTSFPDRGIVEFRFYENQPYQICEYQVPVGRRVPPWLIEQSEMDDADDILENVDEKLAEIEKLVLVNCGRR